MATNNGTLLFGNGTWLSGNGTLLLENGTLTWLGWTQRFLHFEVPRYSLYSFERVPCTFEIHHRYFEGVGNYGLFFVMFMLISVLLVTLSVLVLHVNIIDYNPTNVFLYKVSVFAFGFISFLATIMCFVGYTMVDASLTKAVREQLTPALDTIQEFNRHVNEVGDYAFGMLNRTKQHLTASATTGNWIEQIASKAINAVALPVVNQMMAIEPHVKQLQHVVKEILQLLEMLLHFGRSLLSFAMIYIIFSMFICLWMTSSSLKHAGTGPIICRLSTIVLMVWWLIAGAVTPFLLMLADSCHHPVGVFATICVYMYPDIDPDIIYYYGDCKEPNPLQEKIDKLYTIATYVVGPLAHVVKLLGLVSTESNTLEILNQATAYLTRLEEHGGCKWSGQQATVAFSDICTNMIMGLAMFVLAAIIIAIALTIAVMSCIRLREFKGWPEKSERIFPCPSTCHIHRERKEPLQPCRPKPCRSEIIWPPPKKYDRRITCPITCRGHDRARAALDLRGTCAKTCRGMIPSQPPPPPPVPKAQLRKLMKPKQDKAAVCCIEVYKNNECVQEASICKCHEGADPKAKCDAEKCKEQVTSKGFIGNCGLYKCRFTKLANRRKRKQKIKSPKKPKTKEPKVPTEEADAKIAAEKKSVVKCGIDRCKESYKSAEFKKCQLVKCKKNKKGKNDKNIIEIKPPLPPAEPINPVKPEEQVKEAKGPDVKVKGGDSKNSKIITKAPAKLSKNPAGDSKNPKLSTTAPGKVTKNPAEGPTTAPPVSKPEDVASKKSRNSKKVK